MLRTCSAHALAVAAVAAAAAAQTNSSALGVAFNGDVVRFSSHITTATFVGNCGFTNIGDMTQDLLGRFLASSGGSPTTAAKLVQIDPATGAGTLLATLPVNGEVRGLALTDEHDELFALVRTTSTSLFRLDLTANTATLVGSTGLLNLQALVRGLDGELLAWDSGTTVSNAKGLVRIAANGHATDYNSANDGGSTVQALALTSAGSLIGVRTQVTSLPLTTGSPSAVTGATTFDLRGVAFERGMTAFNGALTLASDGTVGRFNSRTGAVITLGSVGIGGFVGFTRGDATTEFVGARDVAGGVELVSIDPVFVTATTLTTGALPGVRAIAFHAGALYAVANDNAPSDALWTIHPLNGQLNFVGTLTTTSIRSLCSGADNSLYGWDDALGWVRINQSTHAVSEVGTSDGGSFEALGMNSLGRWFAANDAALADPRVFELDVTSGSATPFGASSLGDVQGLAFFDELAFDVGTTYCTAQTNSSGCVPKIASSAIVPASLTHASGFTISATNVLAGKIGILFYGRGRNAVPFQGGTLCVQPPVQRTPPASSGGTVACTGQFALDFNAWIASGADPSLSAGDRIDAQWWSRDPAAVSTTNLTNAIELEIAP